jgi:hypothetical protein
LLADEGALTADDVVELAQRHPDLQAFSPQRACSDRATPQSKDRYARKLAAEPASVQQWRARMNSLEGQAIYARRSNTEHVHARLKNRGLGRMLVRGLAKIRTVCLLHAVTQNLFLALHRNAALA